MARQQLSDLKGTGDEEYHQSSCSIGIPHRRAGGPLAAVTAVPAVATPPSGLTSVTFARGTDLSVGTILFQEGTDVVIVQITVVPGGSSGWHSHPGGAICS